jgi:hypothetical protein
MKETINTYFATLIITIFGAGAALLIVHLASSDTLAASFNNNEASYSALQQSILGQ